MNPIPELFLLTGILAAAPLRAQNTGERDFVESLNLVREAVSAASLRAGNPSPPGSLSVEKFHLVLDRVERVYTPILRARRMRLVFWREWDNDSLQAEAKVMEDSDGFDAVVQVSGGLARHPAMTEDSFSLVVCHELGHHVGGAIEGQADYFAAMKCMRRLHAADDNARLMAGREVPQRVAALCRQAFARENDIALCGRIALAGRQAAYFMADKRGVSRPSLDTPDRTVARETYVNGAPAPQCRLDTYLAGAVCDVGLEEDFSLEDNDPGACTPRRGFAEGARPRCWYASP